MSSPIPKMRTLNPEWFRKKVVVEEVIDLGIKPKQSDVEPTDIKPSRGGYKLPGKIVNSGGEDDEVDSD